MADDKAEEKPADGETHTPEEKPAEEKPEEKKEEGEKSPDSNTMIDNANDAAARLERANAKKEKLLDREEAQRVKETLGGKAEATSQNKEETPEEYKDRVMKNEA